MFDKPNLKKLDAEKSAAGYLLAGCELRDSEVIKIVNFLPGCIEHYQDDTIVWNILNVCLQIMTAYQVFAGFDLDVIMPCLSRLNTECSSYILTFWGFSGNQKYKRHIEPFLSVDGLKKRRKRLLGNLTTGRTNGWGAIIAGEQTGRRNLQHILGQSQNLCKLHLGCK